METVARISRFWQQRSSPRGRNLGLIFLAFQITLLGQDTSPSKASDISQAHVVVEKVSPGLAAAKAGIHSGDKLMRWSSPRTNGGITSSFDLRMLEIEQGCGEPIKIEGVRGTHGWAWILRGERWGLTTRPAMSPSATRVYQEITSLAATGKLLDALQHWQSLINNNSRLATTHLGPWFINRAITVSMQAAQQPSYEVRDQAFAEAVQESIDEGPEVRAALFDRWADSLQERDDLLNAQKFYKEELEEERKLGFNTIAVALTLSDIGIVEIKRGQLPEAEAHFREALAIHNQLAPKAARVAVILGNLAVLAHDRGELATAEVYYRRAIKIDEGYPDRASTLALNVANLGELADRRGDLRAAFRLENRALQIARASSAPRAYIATILSFLGDVALDRGDAKAAAGYQRMALAIRKRDAPGGLSVALSLVSLGNIARIRGELIKAEGLYRQALLIGERLPYPPSELPAFLNALGDLAIKQQDWNYAERLYARSVMLADKMAPSWDQFDAQLGMARAARHKQEWESTTVAYKRAVNILESQTARLGGSDEVRSGFRALHNDFYREYVSFLVEQNKSDLAFEVAENARSRILLELLKSAHADIDRDLDLRLRKRQENLRKLFNEKTQYRIRLLAEEHTDSELIALDAEIKDELRKYHDLEAEIRTANPGYAELTQPRKLSVSEIQALLEPGALLLEYSLGDEHSYVWAVAANSFELHELSQRSEIEKAARRLYWAIASRSRATDGRTLRLRGREGAEYAQAATKLTQLILAPLATILPGKRLVIVADGALQYIPFGALPVPRDTASATDLAADAGRPMILDHEIVSLPSASVLAELRRVREARPHPIREVAVLADPVFEPTDVRLIGRIRPESQEPISKTPATKRLSPNGSALGDQLTRSASDIGLRRNGGVYLQRLLHSREEAEAIMAVTPRGQRMKAIDFRASRATAMNPELGRYRIVHFATHGLVDSKNPELSGLVFSLVNERGKPQDGFLSLEDIYNLRLPVDLVVLSACETGLGEQISGEGLIGLTRGFMYAGASGVVASLWAVNDAATAELMARFYKAMEADGMRPTAALREAQLAMWKQRIWRSPYYWAGFQIQGEWK